MGNDGTIKKSFLVVGHTYDKVKERIEEFLFYFILQGLQLERNDRIFRQKKKRVLQIL